MVAKVFRQLSFQGFLSAPVMDGSQYLGFISLFDIVSYVTNLNWGISGEEWNSFFVNAELWKLAIVKDVMETSMWRGKQSCEPLFQENTTFHALEKLAVSGAHRCIVLEDAISKRVINIFTQSMLISEIHQRIHMLGLLANKRLKEILIPHHGPQGKLLKDVIVIAQSAKAISAFMTMKNSNIHGLGVVDDEGVLIDAISVRDLRGIGANSQHFSRLFLTVKEFKALARAEFPDTGPHPTTSISGATPLANEPVYVTMEQTFSDVINIMAESYLHRVFVCSIESAEEGRPIPLHVISQADVLRAVLDFFAIPAWASRLAGPG
jgi:CBS domain-containing protein